MSIDNLIKLSLPGAFNDQLTEVLRNGARALLAKAVEAEVADFLDNMLICRPRTVGAASCVTATCPRAR